MTMVEGPSPGQAGLVPLDIPVPPSLEAAVGYDGAGRFLALWWEPAGDAVMWSDGQTTTTGWWHGYLAYIRHPKVARYLLDYNLGSSEEPALHRLVFDLVARKAYIGTAMQVTRFLRDYDPRPHLNPEQMEALLRRLRETPLVVDPDMVERDRQFRSLAVDALTEELESHS